VAEGDSQPAPPKEDLTSKKEPAPTLPQPVVDAAVRLATSARGGPIDPEDVRRLLEALSEELFQAAVESKRQRRPLWGGARLRGGDHLTAALDSAGFPSGLLVDADVALFRDLSENVAHQLARRRVDFSQYHARRLGAEITATLLDAATSSHADTRRIVDRFIVAHPRTGDAD
jgi:hypothetical protein